MYHITSLPLNTQPLRAPVVFGQIDKSHITVQKIYRDLHRKRCSLVRLLRLLQEKPTVTESELLTSAAFHPHQLHYIKKHYCTTSTSLETPSASVSHSSCSSTAVTATEAENTTETQTVAHRVFYFHPWSRTFTLQKHITSTLRDLEKEYSVEKRLYQQKAKRERQHKRSLFHGISIQKRGHKKAKTHTLQ